VRTRAPFPPVPIHAPNRREKTLRGCLAAFGIASAPKLEPERPKTDTQLAGALARIVREKPRASVVYLWSPALESHARPEIERALGGLPRRRIEVRWIAMRHVPSIPRKGAPLMDAVADAVSLRTTIAEERGVRALRRLGVRVERPRPPPLSAPPASR
jgi:hypothetical protein